jgi:hypothetical protein
MATLDNNIDAMLASLPELEARLMDDMGIVKVDQARARVNQTQRQRYSRSAERRAEYKRKSDAMRVKLLEAAQAAGVAEPDEATMKAAVWALIIGASYVEHGKVLKLRKSAREFLADIAPALISDEGVKV